MWDALTESFYSRMQLQRAKSNHKATGEQGFLLHIRNAWFRTEAKDWESPVWNIDDKL